MHSIELGFSTKLQHNSNCADYIKNGAYGYIHHDTRTVHTDALLESLFVTRGWNLDYLALWITSNDGRHFCDGLTDLSYSEKALRILNYIEVIYDNGLIYSDQSHGGLLRDTIRIRKEHVGELKGTY